MKISVIIPTYNKWTLTGQRLMELMHFCGDRIYEIVLIDDASVDKFLCLDYWKANSPWKIIFDRNMHNQGFGFSMNSGANRATGDILVFLSNDVEIKRDFTIELFKWIKDSIVANRPILVGAEFLYHDTGWNVIDGMTIPYLNGWFLSCHRNVWKTLGGFDHNLYGISDYEDLDLSLTAVDNDIMLVQLKNHGFRHLGAQSFGYNETRLARTKSNQNHFIQKWRPKMTEELCAKISRITGS